MTQYIIAGVVLAMLLGIGGAFFYGRSSGSNSTQNKSLKKINAIREKQLDEANKPRDVRSTVGSLRDGSF